MIVALYILVLCYSAYFTAWALPWAAHGVRRMAHQPPVALPMGFAAIISAVGFLTIANAPAPVLVGALLVLIGGFFPRLKFLMPLVAVALGVWSFSDFTPHLPLPALLVGFGIVWLIATAAGHRLADRPAAMLPLMVLLGLTALAAFFLHLPASIPLDCAIILAAMYGLLRASGPDDPLAASRPALVYLAVWPALTAAAHLL